LARQAHSYFANFTAVIEILEGSSLKAVAWRDRGV